ncbi:MAG: hypothetical protein DMD41_15450 [Gemmatimonadetes bacterium]|nr:MAG: hypothetical protein DMD41_15450 [Gemmatimonadota bacterium]
MNINAEAGQHGGVMHPGPQKTARLAALAVFAAMLGCKEASAPQAPRVTALAVAGIRVASASFSADGTFELGLVATDTHGDAILSTSVKVTADITSVGNSSASLPAITVKQTRAVQPSGLPVAAGIDIDDSGSMSSNDQNRLRAAAAQTFWETVFTVRSTNQIALFDFGAGTTTGLNDSRLLQDWTSDRTLLAAQLSRLAASGGTPLYESVLDVIGYVNTSRAASQFQRVMLLMTDGQPNSNTNRTNAITAAKNAGIPIHTVGLGPASDVSPLREASAVQAVRELAEQTGGVYASATDAAALAPLFQTLAQVSSQGQLITAFQITPVPASGMRISGTVTVTSGGGTATANWSFVAP